MNYSNSFEVKTCSDCPICAESTKSPHYGFCKLINSVTTIKSMPRKCPLREGPILIKKKDNHD